MKTLANIFTKIQDWTVIVIMTAFIFVILLGTFCRYTQIAVLRWPDEAARYLMIWMAFIAAGTAARHGGHFAVQLVYAFAPKRFHAFFLILQCVLVDLLMLFLLHLSVNIIRKQMFMKQVSPAVGVPMWFMYLAVPVGCFLIMVQGTLRTIDIIKSGKEVDVL